MPLVSRPLLRELFGDGKWRTAREMATFLVGRVSPEDAIRFYNKKFAKKFNVNAVHLDEKRDVGLRSMVLSVVAGMCQNDTGERRRNADGTAEYRILPRSNTKPKISKSGGTYGVTGGQLCYYLAGLDRDATELDAVYFVAARLNFKKGRECYISDRRRNRKDRANASDSAEVTDEEVLRFFVSKFLSEGVTNKIIARRVAGRDITIFDPGERYVRGTVTTDE